MIKVELEERRLMGEKKRKTFLYFAIGFLLLLTCRLVLNPRYASLKKDINQTASLATKITGLAQQTDAIRDELQQTGKVYGDLFLEKDSYISYLGDVTMANNLTINKLTVDDVVPADKDMSSMKAEIELQGTLYDVKNFVQQLYASEVVNRINSFSYRLQNDNNLQWMWRAIDNKNLVDWWNLGETDTASPTPGGEAPLSPLNVQELMRHDIALCYLEIEFMGAGE